MFTAQKIYALLLVLPLFTACGGSGGGSGETKSSSVSSVSSLVASSIASSQTSSLSSSSGAISSSASSAAVVSSSLSSSSSAGVASSSLAVSSSAPASSSSSASDGSPVRVDSGLTERVSNATCIAPDRPASALGSYAFQWVDIPSGIDSPIYLTQAPGVDDRYYILERPGRVKTFLLDDASVTQAIDFSSQVITDGEGGALSMAFHPDFSENRYVYIFLTVSRATYGVVDNDVSMISVVRRYTVSENGLSFTNPVDVLAPLNANDTRLNHQWTNHKGGWIGFSPIDGHLYITLGDKGEGPGNAPIGNHFYHVANDPQSLHGKILRIDVDNGSPYAIPTDNPFADGGGAPEIFALGFRNPWRASFDRLTGDLWVGDVGEDAREEINRVELGGNYGWPFREGNVDRCNNCAHGQQAQPPVVDLPREDGWVAVIGGYVYRGDAMPELQGRYIFGDFIRQGASTISYDGNAEAVAEDLVVAGGSAPSFSEDNDGNIWRVHPWGGFERLARTSTAPVQELPATLSATGCFDPDNIRAPAAGVIPYELNSPLWSDGATKERYFALPDGTNITIQENGNWSFPLGSILIKTFLLNGAPLETRLLVRHDDGDWGGYSYEWNDEGTEAYLLSAGKTKTVGEQLWRYPSRAQCMNCHTAPSGDFAAERVLGPETAQINRDFIYAGNLIANQIQTLATVGYFSTNPGSPASLAHMPAPLDDEAPLTNRARAYLHSNCANCHQPNGPGRGGMDFRYSTYWGDGGYCNESPSFGSFGIADARLLKPGVAGESIIPLRMQRTDAHRMPPLGVDMVDSQGVAVLEAWINSLLTCP